MFQTRRDREIEVLRGQIDSLFEIYQYLMNKSKLRKIALKSNQNSADVAENLTFVPLLDFRNGQLQIVHEGLSVLEDQCASKTYLVGYEGVTGTLLFSLYRNSTIRSEEPTRSGVWISNYPRVDPQTGDQYLFLEIVGLTHDEKAKLHVVCSLLCSCVLINLEEADSLAHLTALEGRVIYSSSEKDANKNKLGRKREMTFLTLLQRSKGRGVAMKGEDFQIYETLNKINIYDHCVDLYTGISLLHLSVDGTDLHQIDALEQQIKDTVVKTFSKSPELTNGAILGFYLEQLVASVNHYGMVDIDKCSKAIQVSPGYHAFEKAVELYHGRLNRNLKDEGVRNLKEELLNYRAEATEEFKRYSTDGAYLLRLGEYIDSKELRLIEENNKTFELSNINFLKNESKTLLDKVSKDKVSEQESRRLIDKLVNDYRNQAQGDNRFELLTNCLTILEPAVHRTIAERSIQDVKRETDKAKGEKLELQNRIADLQANLRKQREKSSKCCEIM